MEQEQIQRLSQFLTGYSAVCALIGLSLICWLLVKYKQTDSKLSFILGRISRMPDLEKLSDEKKQHLQEAFHLIPAMALCLQRYFQAFIPPQPPYEEYYKSGSEAVQVFDKDFIVKQTVSQKLFGAVPAILISFGVLGSVIGFAASIAFSKNIFLGSPGNMQATYITTLFAVGSKTFWPILVTLFLASVFQVSVTSIYSALGNKVLAISMLLDAQLPTQTIEKIAAVSLIELRKQHETITAWSQELYPKMSEMISHLISRGGGHTFESLMQQQSERLAQVMGTLGNMVDEHFQNALNSMEACSLQVSKQIQVSTSDVQGGIQDHLEFTKESAEKIQSILQQANSTIQNVDHKMSLAVEGISNFENIATQFGKTVETQLRKTQTEIKEKIEDVGDLQIYNIQNTHEKISKDLTKEVTQISDNLDELNHLLTQMPLSKIEVVKVPPLKRKTKTKITKETQFDEEDKATVMASVPDRDAS